MHDIAEVESSCELQTRLDNLLKEIAARHCEIAKIALLAWKVPRLQIPEAGRVPEKFPNNHDPLAYSFLTISHNSLGMAPWDQTVFSLTRQAGEQESRYILFDQHSDDEAAWSAFLCRLFPEERAGTSRLAARAMLSVRCFLLPAPGPGIGGGSARSCCGVSSGTCGLQSRCHPKVGEFSGSLF